MTLLQTLAGITRIDGNGNNIEVPIVEVERASSVEYEEQSTVVLPAIEITTVDNDYTVYARSLTSEDMNQIVEQIIYRIADDDHFEITSVSNNGDSAEGRILVWRFSVKKNG